MKKKILIITFYFPPQGGVGALRRLKFAHYIREKGWEPIILTAYKLSFRNEYDNSFNEITKEIKTYSSLSFDHSTLMNMFKRAIKNKKKKISGNEFKLKIPSNRKIEIIKKISRKIKLYIVPDDYVGWLPITLLKAIYIITKYKPDCIYTSCKPYTTHIIGYILKKIYKIKWLTDFSDLWVEQTVTYDNLPTNWHKRVSKYLEKKVISNADKIITIAEPMKLILQSKYKNIEHSKFDVIYNGFDKSDFKNNKIKKNNKFTICYTGSLYSKKGFSNNPLIFIRSLEKLFVQNPKIRDKIKVIIVGEVDDFLLTKIKEKKLSTTISYNGFVGYSESIKIIEESDIALLLMNDRKAALSVIPTKIFDYIGANKNIFAIAYDGITTKIIKDGRLGVVVDPENIDNIVNSLYELYIKWRNNSLTVDYNDNLLREFDRRFGAFKLAKFLDEVTAISDVTNYLDS